jgi:serine/threonine protein kinase
MNSYAIADEGIENPKNSIVYRKSANDSLIKEKTSTIFSDKNYYSNIYNMKCFIRENEPNFFEIFELEEFLNYGSTGYVFKGKCKLNKRPLALKFIIKRSNIKRKEKKDSKNDTSHEIKIWKNLHNSKVSEMYSYLRINKDCKFLVLEYAKYGDLNYFMNFLLKRRVLSETALNYFGKQILEGIEYIHRCKIVHMDIKPGNILIDSDLYVKLTDFSVSCSYSSLNP